MQKSLNIWKRFAIKSSKGFSGFLREESMVSQSPGTGIKSFVNDGLGKFNENMINCSLENIERIWDKREIFFVVDWQMFDSI
jgi:hypothetical protein